MSEELREFITLLEALIALPSPSGEEEGTARCLEGFFADRRIPVQRIANNLIVRNRHFDAGKMSILLNSHHDTVRPNPGWRRDPFCPSIEDGRLYGLGSNDAGASLVTLISSFLHYYDSENLPFNLILIASSEEENSGARGMELALTAIDPPLFAIVGEPTGMHMAIAEKGLMVLDCTAEGRSGHAAREEGINAIYEAMSHIQWFRSYRFPRESPFLGPVKMTVTQVQAGTQHNVVPEICRFVVDVRTTDAYSNGEVLDIIRNHVQCRVQPRSTRLQPSGIPADHPLVLAASHLEIPTYGSPTCSDQALMNFPSVKIGPGDSARSHTADEYVGLDELEEGLRIYRRLLGVLLFENPEL